MVNRICQLGSLFVFRLFSLWHLEAAMSPKPGQSRFVLTVVVMHLAIYFAVDALGHSIVRFPIATVQKNILRDMVLILGRATYTLIVGLWIILGWIVRKQSSSQSAVIFSLVLACDAFAE
jgi:hypothetical protein